MSEKFLFPENLDADMVRGFVQLPRGSTCPHHGWIDGRHYVLKCGSYSSTSSDAHVHNEFVADEFLRAAGCLVPESREYRADIGHGKVETIRLSRYLENACHLGAAWAAASDENRRKILDQIVRTFPVKSFIDDMDTYQHAELDNVMVDEDYNLWFIDNGASFDFRAKGARKGWFWERTDIHGQFGYFSLRDAKRSIDPRMFDQHRLKSLLKDVSDEDLRSAAGKYEFSELVKSLPDDYRQPSLVEYAKNLDEWARPKEVLTFSFTVDYDKYAEGREDAADMIDDKREHKGMIKTVLGDITKFDGDAIVNAGNEAGLGGGGVDGAIHRAAGPMLYAECLMLPEVRPGVRCPTGEARITLAGDLPCKHVILTVGPVYRDGRHGEPELLANCYRNSLALAAANGVKSIAFPSIATGVYGYPAEDAARIAVREVKAFLADHPDLEVTFVLFNGPRDRIDMKALYDRLLSS